jgi:hypothetical protein
MKTHGTRQELVVRLVDGVESRRSVLEAEKAKAEAAKAGKEAELADARALLSGQEKEQLAKWNEHVKKLAEDKAAEHAARINAKQVLPLKTGTMPSLSIILSGSSKAHFTDSSIKIGCRVKTHIVEDDLVACTARDQRHLYQQLKMQPREGTVNYIRPAPVQQEYSEGGAAGGDTYDVLFDDGSVGRGLPQKVLIRLNKRTAAGSALAERRSSMDDVAEDAPPLDVTELHPECWKLEEGQLWGCLQLPQAMQEALDRLQHEAEVHRRHTDEERRRVAAAAVIKAGGARRESTAEGGRRKSSSTPKLSEMEQVQYIIHYAPYTMHHTLY